MNSLESDCDRYMTSVTLIAAELNEKELVRRISKRRTFPGREKATAAIRQNRSSSSFGASIEESREA